MHVCICKLYIFLHFIIKILYNYCIATVNWCKMFNPDPNPNVDILSKTDIKALFMDLKKYLLLIHAHDTCN